MKEKVNAISRKREPLIKMGFIILIIIAALIPWSIYIIGLWIGKDNPVVILKYADFIGFYGGWFAALGAFFLGYVAYRQNNGLSNENDIVKRELNKELVETQTKLEEAQQKMTEAYQQTNKLYSQLVSIEKNRDKSYIHFSIDNKSIFINPEKSTVNNADLEAEASMRHYSNSTNEVGFGCRVDSISFVLEFSNYGGYPIKNIFPTALITNSLGKHNTTTLGTLKRPIAKFEKGKIRFSLCEHFIITDEMDEIPESELIERFKRRNTFNTIFIEFDVTDINDDKYKAYFGFSYIVSCDDDKFKITNISIDSTGPKILFQNDDEENDA